MKYLISERQYNLLIERDEILKIPFSAFGDDWNLLQRFLERRGNPPYELSGNVDLEGKNIKSLGSLTSVGGFLDLSESSIESLGNLTYVDGHLSLYNSSIESLGSLTSVGGTLYLQGTPIKSLGNLTSVGGSLYLRNTPISKKYSREEIRQMVNVGGDIYI